MAEERSKPRSGARFSSRTLLQLVIASILVGALLALFDISPIRFWQGFFDAARELISAIGESFGDIMVNLATYFLLGAAIVAPVWIVLRLFSGGRKK